MKNFISTTFLLLFSLFSFSTFATTYYLSSSSGNDNNSGTDPSSAWRSIDKLSSFYNLRPGDNVLFKSGDTFYGSIKVNNSGNSGSPITYGAYGSGSKPIITGFTNVTSWNNLGGNIWESSNAVSTLSTCNMVVVNGVNTAMGRYPNTGYLTYQSHNGNTSISSSSLNGSTNWTGAGIAIKKQRWFIEPGSVTGQSGNTIYFSDNGTFTPQDGFGFFIQNDPRTLDQQNEWYFNPSTKKLRIYSFYQPTNVQLATVENTFENSTHKNYLTINGIAFTGANNTILNFQYGQNVTIANCDLSNSGIIGIYVNGVNTIITGNSINTAGYTAMQLDQDCTGASVTNNTVINTCLIPGTIVGGGGAAIYSNGAGSTIQGNMIDNSGWSGITFYGNNSIVKNNFINHSCLVTDDGGGIYTHGGYTGQKIIGNIVLNSIGAPDGTNDTGNILAHGIFLDDLSKSVTVTGNSISGCHGVGIDLHRAADIDVSGNTCFDNGVKGNWMKGAIMFQCDANNPVFNGIDLNNNIFFAKTIDQLAFFYYLNSPNESDIKQFGAADNNYYARPIDDNNAILVNVSYFNVQSWRSYIGQEANSKGAPKSITDVNDLRFDYNASSSAKTISLDANYIDVKNVSYNGSITLQPYSSAVLIRNGARTSNKPPTANAGSDRVIQLPSNSVILPGSGTDSDGSIVSYSWTQLSGPTSATMNNTSSAQSGAGDLKEGNYVFQLTVTDNSGATGASDLNVTVESVKTLAAPNIPPVAGVGDNRTIQMPKNSIVLPGSGTDEDGYIASYSWKQLSGPSTATLINTSSAQGGAGNLVEGVYVFQLTVTDNQGATGTSLLKVTVNSDNPNIPPVANVGSNRVIDLPKNSIVLPGSGSDEDGYIASYSWTQVSGPSSATMVNPSSAQAGADNLVEGDYQFQLTVTDDQGATGTANLYVTVNSENPNIPPIANVGSDREIQLPKNSIVLPGSGSDADGWVNSYSWNQISGPSSATMVNSSSASAGAGDLIAGTYVFQLTVTDDQGATGSALLNVKVDNGANQARIGNLSAKDSNATAGMDTVKLATVPGNKLLVAPPQLKIYPNPAHDLVNIEINPENASPDAEITITDMSGRAVYKKIIGSAPSNIQQINVSGFKAGTYIVTLSLNGIEIQSAKLVKL